MAVCRKMQSPVVKLTTGQNKNVTMSDKVRKSIKGVYSQKLLWNLQVETNTKVHFTREKGENLYLDGNLLLPP